MPCTERALSGATGVTAQPINHFHCQEQCNQSPCVAGAPSFSADEMTAAQLTTQPSGRSVLLGSGSSAMSQSPRDHSVKA